MQEEGLLLRQLLGSFATVGTVAPSSEGVCRAMASELAVSRAPRLILEVGPGTGPITTRIAEHLGPDDQLVLCELNPQLAAFLRQRIATDPLLSRIRDRATVHTGDVTALERSPRFDHIISSVPFTSLPPEVVEAILEAFRGLLKPGGTVTYLEYIGLRKAKRWTIGWLDPGFRKVHRLLDQTVRRHEFRRQKVWRNVPPAWIRHLRFQSETPGPSA